MSKVEAKKSKAAVRNQHKKDIREALEERDKLIGQALLYAYELGLHKGKGSPVEVPAVVQTAEGEKPGVHKPGKKDLRSNIKELKEETKAINKMIAEALKPVKGTKRKNTGFKAPFLVSDNFAAFFREANLGKGPNGKPLSSSLGLLTSRDVLNSFAKQFQDVGAGKHGDVVHAITNRDIISAIWPLYASLNGLANNAVVALVATKKKDKAGNIKMKAKPPSEHPGAPTYRQGDLEEDQRNYSLYGADDLMRKHFGAVFQALADEEPGLTRTGRERSAFDPNCFNYVKFQSLIKACRVQPSTDTERALLNKEPTDQGDGKTFLPFNQVIIDELLTEHTAAKSAKEAHNAAKEAAAAKAAAAAGLPAPKPKKRTRTTA